MFGNICIFGGVSGGHFNPAVTLGVFISESWHHGNLSKFKQNWWIALLIMSSQVAGVFFGCVSSFLVQHIDKDKTLPGIAIMVPNNTRFDIDLYPTLF